MKKAIVGIVIALAVLIGAWFLLFDPPRTDYYTQIDNSKCEENRSDGGVVDLTGKMEHLYTLQSYTADGKEKEITFGTDRILKDKAYLKLEYAPLRGVLAWSEVSCEELPQSVKNKFQQF